jgi:hypothetical protein
VNEECNRSYVATKPECERIGEVKCVFPMVREEWRWRRKGQAQMKEGVGGRTLRKDYVSRK